ncbi:MAG: hypothetical protein L0271_06600 [Gemmatimonadetes bacterium]|nr:hypothetical protein [Gemmatimonadota bacterium]
MYRILLAVVVLSLFGTPLAAQADHQHSPYAGRPGSGIAALTVEELEDLENGAGMGFALAAELNHYPGPRHVLELADSLALTADQRSRVTVIFERMLENARRVGAQVIAAESDLDQRFKHAHIDAAAARTATMEIGRLRGELRAIHLIAHLDVTAVLSMEQVEIYDRLRGYPQAGDPSRR